MIASIWAQTSVGVIGRAGGIPWHYPGDLRRFKRLTLGAVVIMGRKTFESIGRPLPGRRNIVVGSTSDCRSYWPGPAIVSELDETTTVIRARDLDNALSCAADARGKDVWFIGGARIYAEAMAVVEVLDVTIVPDDIPGGPDVVYAPWIEERRAWRQESAGTHPDEPGLVLQRWVRQ